MLYELEGDVRVKVTLGVRRSGRGHLSPTPPTQIGWSPDISIMQAWMAAEMAQPSQPCRELVQEDGELVRCGQCPSCVRHRETIVVAVETAVRQVQTVDAKRVLGKYYYRLPAAVRPLLGQRGEVGLKRLLGRWVRYERDEQEQLARAALDGVEHDPESGWIAGLAGLSEREAQAYWSRLRGQSRLFIARELTSPERQHDRALWVSLKTVSNLCWLAKVKVLTVFGLNASGEPDEQWSDGEPDEG